MSPEPRQVGPFRPPLTPFLAAFVLVWLAWQIGTAIADGWPQGCSCGCRTAPDPQGRAEPAGASSPQAGPLGVVR